MPPMAPSAPGWNDPPSLTFEKPVPNQVSTQSDAGLVEYPYNQFAF